MRIKRTGSAQERHGLSKSPEYEAWKGMLKRCFRKTYKEYHLYGGRGITVCDRWANSFATFYEDMGQRPTPRHSLDRSDNDKNYEPGNVVWETKARQSRNQRRAKLTWDQVVEIRRLSAEGVNNSELGRRFGVVNQMVSMIVLRQAWKTQY